MTIKYFNTKGEAMTGIPEDILEKCYAGTLTPVINKAADKYCVAFYDAFGEPLGVLQEDGTVQKEQCSQRIVG